MNSRLRARKTVLDSAAPLRVLRVNSDPLFFLSSTLIRNSCVHDRNALNSFSFMHLRASSTVTDGRGLTLRSLASLLCSPISALCCFALFALSHPVCFQSNTNCPFCNHFVLTTIRIGGGVGTPPLPQQLCSLLGFGFASSATLPRELSPLPSVIHCWKAAYGRDAPGTRRALSLGSGAKLSARKLGWASSEVESLV